MCGWSVEVEEKNGGARRGKERWICIIDGAVIVQCSQCSRSGASMKEVAAQEQGDCTSVRSSFWFCSGMGPTVENARWLPITG
jgi:hypothetical protein